MRRGTKSGRPIFIFVVIIWLSLIHVSYFNNLKSNKYEDLKIIFIFLPSLSEYRDEIPVKWGSLSHPKIFDFGLWIENIK
jgi:hypothetical protein